MCVWQQAWRGLRAAQAGAHTAHELMLWPHGTHLAPVDAGSKQCQLCRLRQRPARPAGCRGVVSECLFGRRLERQAHVRLHVAQPALHQAARLLTRDSAPHSGPRRDDAHPGARGGTHTTNAASQPSHLQHAPKRHPLALGRQHGQDVVAHGAWRRACGRLQCAITTHTQRRRQRRCRGRHGSA